MTRPRKKIPAQAGFEPGTFRSRGGSLTTRPTRRWWSRQTHTSAPRQGRGSIQELWRTLNNNETRQTNPATCFNGIMQRAISVREIGIQFHKMLTPKTKAESTTLTCREKKTVCPESRVVSSSCIREKKTRWAVTDIEESCLFLLYQKGTTLWAVKDIEERRLFLLYHRGTALWAVTDIEESRLFLLYQKGTTLWAVTDIEESRLFLLYRISERGNPLKCERH